MQEAAPSDPSALLHCLETLLPSSQMSMAQPSLHPCCLHACMRACAAVATLLIAAQHAYSRNRSLLDEVPR